MNITALYGQRSRWIGVQLAGDLLMSADTESIYYSDGGSCRNGGNGQYADSSNCAPAIDFAVRGEIALRAGDSGVSFGPGGRIGKTVKPYGFIQYERGAETVFLIRGLAGRELMQFELGLGVNFGRRSPVSADPTP